MKRFFSHTPAPKLEGYDAIAKSVRYQEDMARARIIREKARAVAEFEKAYNLDIRVYLAQVIADVNKGRKE